MSGNLFSKKKALIGIIVIAAAIPILYFISEWTVQPFVWTSAQLSTVFGPFASKALASVIILGALVILEEPKNKVGSKTLDVLFILFGLVLVAGWIRYLL